MKIEEVAGMSDAAAWKILFPPEMPYGACSAHKNWQQWREPRAPLAIDKFLTEFADSKPKRRDAASLKSPQELAAPPLRIQCPYFHCRHSIWLAIRRGAMWAQAVEFHRAEKVEKNAKRERAAELANAIKLYLAGDGIDWSISHPIPLYVDRGDPDYCASRAEDCRKLEQVLWTAQELLTSHAAQIKSDGDRISVHRNAARHSWKAGFVAALGFCWRNLTGKDPSLSTKSKFNFLSLIEAAYDSIGGDPKEKWDRTVRQILHKRPKPPEWDGFDRYERDRMAPGTKVLDWKDWAVKVSHMQEQYLQEVRAYGLL
jgi:hypothetical protein